MTQPDLDSWKPPALREAEAQLDETMTKARDLIKKTEEKLKQLPDVDHTAKPEDIQRLKAAAERPDAPAEMRALKKKVDAGELSWKDVLEGKALKDPVVQAAMGARLGEMREIYQEAEAGATLEEILEARGVTGSVFNGDGPTRPAPPAAPPQPHRSAPIVRPPEDNAPEDYFENPLAKRDEPKRPEPPRRRPRTDDPPDDDDDYFGGPVLR